MCCCGQPTKNGELGFRWNNPNAAPSVRPVNPPALIDGDTLLFDEPGRCGGIDSHCHHYRVVRHGGTVWLLVRHGGGDQRIRMSNGSKFVEGIANVDSDIRYWLLNAMYHAQHDAMYLARQDERQKWQMAAVDKRIRVRRRNGSKYVVILPIQETV